MSLPLKTWHAILANLDDVTWYLRGRLACGPSVKPPKDPGGAPYGWPCSKDDREGLAAPGSDLAAHRELHEMASKLCWAVGELGKGTVSPEWEEPHD